MSAVQAHNITKQFGDRVVLSDVSLNVDSGELLWLSGRSGSGKSTFMNILAGLEVPTAGRVVVAGQDLATMNEERRARFRLDSIGFVFQGFQLIPDLTVEENVRLPMTLSKRPHATERSQELLEYLGLAGHASHFPETLSGGEMQRVAIARALGNDPPLLLADEPTANLDEANACNVLEALRTIAEAGRTVILGSHDPLSVHFATRQEELADGRLVPSSSALEAPTAGVGAREDRKASRAQRSV